MLLGFYCYVLTIDASFICDSLIINARDPGDTFPSLPKL